MSDEILVPMPDLIYDLWTHPANGEGMATLSFTVKRTVILDDDEWDKVERELITEVMTEAEEQLRRLRRIENPRARRIYEHGAQF